MAFKAYDEINKKIIRSWRYSEEDWREIIENRNDESQVRFTCTSLDFNGNVCGERLKPIDGKQVRSHFRHYPDRSKECESSKDFLHDIVEKMIINEMEKLGIIAQEEVIIPLKPELATAFDKNNLRADVFYEINGIPNVIEIQLSRQSDNDYIKRTVAYYCAGIGNVTWFALQDKDKINAPIADIRNFHESSGYIITSRDKLKNLIQSDNGFEWNTVFSPDPAWKIDGELYLDPNPGYRNNRLASYDEDQLVFTRDRKIHRYKLWSKQAILSDLIKNCKSYRCQNRLNLTDFFIRKQKDLREEERNRQRDLILDIKEDFEDFIPQIISELPLTFEVCFWDLLKKEILNKIHNNKDITDQDVIDKEVSFHSLLKWFNTTLDNEVQLDLEYKESLINTETVLEESIGIREEIRIIMEDLDEIPIYTDLIRVLNYIDDRIIFDYNRNSSGPFVRWLSSSDEVLNLNEGESHEYYEYAMLHDLLEHINTDSGNIALRSKLIEIDGEFYRGYKSDLETEEQEIKQEINVEDSLDDEFPF